ncbi:hypothetical protein TAO_1138 [Candidatus Nitrosoglobus terrae]|uniref:Glycoside-hydrolase family GH114 TIM-barrel domain-containing protein n=1 Tax=Candidatus Nitrosoglobus terrae TaxID=1630141 RepID=A0A1Q2SMY8_9GAMM|nr:hypothetical protein TAO_1138 [Candidatus Nitrosoglobus terrae]
MKNDLDQISDLVDHYDFATNEQCFQYNECNMLLPFIQSGKPVLEIEYSIPTSKFCPQANSMNFDALAKKLELDAWREACR